MTSKKRTRLSFQVTATLYTQLISRVSASIRHCQFSFLEGSHEGKDIYICGFFFYRSVKYPVKNIFCIKNTDPLNHSSSQVFYFSFFALSSSHNNININLGSYRNKTSCEITSMIYTSNCILSKVVSWRRSAQFHSTGAGVFYI